MRGRGLMLVAGMRAGEKRGAAQAEEAQQQQEQQQQLEEAQKQAAEAQQQAAAAQKQAAAAPPVPAGGGSDVTAQLQKLAELHQQGILSDQEFVAAKQKVLRS